MLKKLLRATVPAIALAGLCAALPAAAQAIRAVTDATAHTYSDDGKVPGPATEVVKQVFARAGLTDYSIAIYPWARAYDMALNQPDVLLYLVARTPARESLFQWVGEVTRIQYHLYRRPDRADILVASLADAQRYAIGVVRDDVRQTYLQQQGFTRLAPFAQPIEGVRRLLAGQIDLMPLNDAEAATLCAATRPQCSELARAYTLDGLGVYLYMAYSRGTADALVARTRAAFDQLRAEGVVKRIMELPPAPALKP
ncbi:transporter substrate-binding domain-containing protein [Ramlibacter sp. H39-3-26]|uniref:substrate-binding periplasmic protein n=1 Tax=Curvibacter soli TaxID=3031331 RepID=UPI0023DC17C2|nr:transporter substrate-binding domain-containing protein [Ramlibacter sp. H39-3-26]MDF1484583.1 transporter substrate-binding domain-containing protein [Ramlibacter sp. H39-3-26]